MKRIKIGVVIVLLIAVIYFMISYSIFLYKKPSIDAQLHVAQLQVEDTLVGEKFIDQHEQQNKKQNESVVIQNMAATPCKKHADASCDVQSHFIVTSDEQDEPVMQVTADDQQEFIVTADQNMHRPVGKSHSHSFITMKISDDYEIDQETQDTLDMLIGNDVDIFVKLMMQSNNNIVSKEACRSCGMYAFFNGIKNHKPLTTDDIRMLQKMLANLYRFVGKMKKLNKDVEIMNQEQYEALQTLHTSQAVKNNAKLQARRATTAAALKKLQNIKYNK
ncbi:MAG: hypothetical protein Q8Q60_01950 [Candidatus Chromulinivorax sp.]|nr:hypothetical protein [Candidatus Chromulinivorax sp.]